ncbi:hypothetical protein Tco_1295469 [Tanacetum coccineum]
MGDENPIRTLGDYSKPSHEGYRNTIELLVGNNVALLEDLALYDNESWNDPRDFAKPVKAITLPQDVPMNKITTSCEICSGPHDTQYCMEDPEQAFVEYTSSRTDVAGARLSKFEDGFKQQQSEMTNKIYTMSKAITDRIERALPSDTVKNPKLSTSPPKQQIDSHNDRTEENEEEKKDSLENTQSTPPNPSISFITKKVLKFNSLFESLGLVPPSPNAELVCTKNEDGDVMFIEIISRDDNSHKEEPKAEVQ